ncbi:MAG: DUF4493 domain-containing protein [Bacteroidales bacterium]|nr:DUF4493 domain-containing protein [Bacteroidales bacterium]
MRKTIITFLTCSGLLLAACSKGDADGNVVFRVEENPIAEVVTKGNVSDYTALPAAADFSLVVKNSLGATVYSGLLGAWDESTALPNGDYTVSATYGSSSSEGPAKPCFEGETDFLVLGGETTSVSIPVSLGNCIVKIACTDAFRNYYPGRTFTVTTPETPSGFTYADKALFVAYQWTIGGTLVNQAGVSYALPEKTWKGSPATCYTVKYDVSNAGDLTITVSFDDTVETVTLEEIELNS